MVLTGADEALDTAGIPETLIQFDFIEGDTGEFIRVCMHIPVVDPADRSVNITLFGFFLRYRFAKNTREKLTIDTLRREDLVHIFVTRLRGETVHA